MCFFVLLDKRVMVLPYCLVLDEGLPLCCCSNEVRATDSRRKRFDKNFSLSLNKSRSLESPGPAFLNVIAHLNM